ncbi:hypothetical protein ACF3DV_25370 [Chlorogloeopsis fritschii PCC 9212]|jgi:GDP-D-mannose dehydratase|uniref:Uncharacterized protein n=1 Tax=Chlorogloeopsis fritschii PCC 6912 TaxID=211165 RepID=A0A3S0ZDC2_CHLFR|nr:hypothetical protein [Chlorogloeopsis fritschii]RUR73946.1 hypothetical protein PCC6912_54870 [Chlorogloeopsis fritschii PCC 6912]
MAFYVVLLKDSEDDKKVVYYFGSSEEKLGRLELDKLSGEVKEIEPAPTNNSSALFVRASAKIYRHWQQRNFPEKSCWAS